MLVAIIVIWIMLALGLTWVTLLARRRIAQRRSVVGPGTETFFVSSVERVGAAVGFGAVASVLLYSACHLSRNGRAPVEVLASLGGGVVTFGTAIALVWLTTRASVVVTKGGAEVVTWFGNTTSIAFRDCRDVIALRSTTGLHMNDNTIVWMPIGLERGSHLRSLLEAGVVLHGGHARRS